MKVCEMGECVRLESITSNDNEQRILNAVRQEETPVNTRPNQGTR